MWESSNFKSTTTQLWSQALSGPLVLRVVGHFPTSGGAGISMLAALNGSRVRWVWLCNALGSQANPAGLFVAGVVNGFVRSCNEASTTVIREPNSGEDGTEKVSDDNSRAQRITTELRLREQAKKSLVLDILSLADGNSVEFVLDKWIKQHTASGEQHFQVSSVHSPTIVRTLHGVIQDLAQQGLAEPAWQVFQWMELEGWCVKDPHVYTTMIKIFGDSFSVDRVERLYASLEDSKVEKDTTLLNAVLCARSRAGRVEAVLELFNKMEQLSCKRDRVTYNIMMDTCVKIGTALGTVVHLFKQMCQEGIQPDIISYNILLSACVSGRHVKEAMHAFKILRKRGLKPTVVTYTTLLRVHASAGGCSEALKIYAEMVSRGCRPSAVTFSSLISACAREGLAEEAESIFEGMEEFEVEPNVATFNVMMDMYTKQGNSSGVEQMMEMMTKAGLQPTVVTYTTLISCYKAVGAPEKVLSVYNSVKQSSSLSNVLTFTQALDACIKCGRMSKISGILSDMKLAGHEPNVVTCSVILSALGTTARSEEDRKALLDSLRCFTSNKLVHTCLAILSNEMEDDEVINTTTELLVILEGDGNKSQVIFFTSLLDALWISGWRRRGSLVLGVAMDKGAIDDICIVSPQEWKLDIRTLSTGGSLVALYQWLSHLSQVAFHFAKAKQRDIPDSTLSWEGQADPTAERPKDDDAGDDGDVDTVSSADSLTEADYSFEIVLPLLPSSWRDTSRSPTKTYRISAASPSLPDRACDSPRIVTIVTGWGKLSKQQGASQVKTVIEKELTKLKAPFQASADSGRWVARFEALMYWLLRPQTLARMALSDSLRKGTRDSS